MGKASVMRTLGKRVGNVVLHKLLVKYTNKPESRHHLQNEEITYRDEAIKDAKEYNWNGDDYKELKGIAMEFIKDKRSKKYPDVIFLFEEAERLVEE